MKPTQEKTMEYKQKRLKEFNEKFEKRQWHPNNKSLKEQFEMFLIKSIDDAKGIGYLTGLSQGFDLAYKKIKELNNALQKL